MSLKEYKNLLNNFTNEELEEEKKIIYNLYIENRISRDEYKLRVKYILEFFNKE